MTWKEMFQKLLGQKLDEEIDVEAETGAQGNPEGAGGDSGTGADTGAGEPENGSGGDSGGDSGGAEGGDPGTGENTNEEDNNVPVFNDGWFDPKTMTFDPTKITDEATRNALQTVADAIKENNNALAIERAINDQIAKAGITVSPETFRKCLDTSNIKLGADGKVTGVTEAFEALRKSDAKLFTEISKENSPLNEGFSPVNKTNASNNFRSFAEALEAEKALN